MLFVSANCQAIRLKRKLVDYNRSFIPITITCWRASGSEWWWLLSLVSDSYCFSHCLAMLFLWLWLLFCPPDQTVSWFPSLNEIAVSPVKTFDSRAHCDTPERIDWDLTTITRGNDRLWCTFLRVRQTGLRCLGQFASQRSRIRDANSADGAQSLSSAAGVRNGMLRHVLCPYVLQQTSKSAFLVAPMTHIDLMMS